MKKSLEQRIEEAICEEISIVHYNPEWPVLFDNEAEFLRRQLPESLIRRIEHFGSTAIPGLAAKPIIDILVVVRDSADEDSYVPALEALGYRLRVREPDFHEHRMLRPPSREVHIHVFSVGSLEIGRYLTFRDRLRSDPEDKLLYEQTKRELARREWTDVNDYADAKTDVIEAIIARGRQ